jgi:hypothetical protein
MEDDKSQEAVHWRPFVLLPPGTCTMHINYHFDALLVLYTRTASIVDAMEVQTQCRGAPTEFRYWSRGVCWRG